MAAENRTAEPWWEVLCVSSNATLEEVAGAYRELAKHDHPDRWPNASKKQRAMTGARMKRINAAFERAKEDISLREERKSAAAAANARKAAAEAAAAKHAEEERKAAAAAAYAKQAAAEAAAEEERKAAAAAAYAKKAAAEATAANQAEQAAAHGQKKPNARGLFTRGLGPSLASIALILLGGYVIRALQTQHVPVHDRTIADLPQPAPLTPHPEPTEVAPAPHNTQPTTAKQSGGIETREEKHFESGPILADQQTQPNADISGAIALCTERIRLDPQRAENYIDRGIYYCRMGKLNQAVADLTQAISIAPHVAKAYHNRGVVRIMQGKFELAINDFDSAIGLDPTYTVAYANRNLAVQRKREEEHNAYLPAPQSSNSRTTMDKAVDRKTTVQSNEEYYRKRAAAKRGANSP